MQMSLLTNSLTDVGVKDLKAIADWAADNDIHELDVGPAIAMDEKVFSDVLSEGRVKINTMIYCRNFLSEDAEGLALVPAEIFEEKMRRLTELARTGE